MTLLLREQTSKGRGGGGNRERLPAGSSTPVVPFERERLALFARYGFEAESRRITDRHGRATYLLVRGEGPRPTVLVHGGLSQASEWAPLAGRVPDT